MIIIFTTEIIILINFFTNSKNELAFRFRHIDFPNEYGSGPNSGGIIYKGKS
jgi:hypothetical protein